MKRPLVYDAFGAPPVSLPPSVPVRRWDEAMLVGAFVFALVYVALAFALFRPLPGLETPGVSFGGLLAAGLNVRMLSDAPAALSVRALFMLTGGLAMAGAAFARALKPQVRLRHVSGPRLLQGLDAEKAAHRLAAAERRNQPGFLRLHPALDLPKSRWTKHMLIYGSVGSGKTQILMPIVEQAFAKNLKLFCFDVKGDYTACFPSAALLSPWDERSRVWDIGRDLAGVSDAATFAQAVIPADESGANRFFSIAAQQLLFGAVRSLQNTRGQRWGWEDLGARVGADRENFVRTLQEHYPKAAALIADGTSTATSSVLATLASYTQVIDGLVAAWGKTDGRKLVSLRKWVRDDFRGRRQIIVQAGADSALTSAYIGAMVKLLQAWIVGPALPDDEMGRCLLFVLDELPALKVDISALIDKGRSKGVCVFAGLQDLAQLRDAIGDNKTIALSSMVGTHVVCRVQMGESREQIAAMFGRERVAVTAQSSGAGAGGSSTTFSVHEETRAVVEPSMLGDLGKQEGKRKDWPCGFAIRALVSLGGGDVLELDFPGTSLPRKQAAFVPAPWTWAVRARVPTVDEAAGAWAGQRWPEKTEGMAQRTVEERALALTELAARFAASPGMD